MNQSGVYPSLNGTGVVIPVMQRFCDDVIRGLTSSPKYLESKYFYDSKGDRLFQEIMSLPEYYLTNCELEIFSRQTDAIADLMIAQGDDFDLIELGAGDALKSTFLLEALLKKDAQFNFLPIDISANVISMLNDQFSKTLPGLNFTGLNGEYFEMLQKASTLSGKRKVVLFLGSNIGNMLPAEVLNFCNELRTHLSPGDMVLIGFDLKKNPKTILDAYNDKAGITRQFNFNLLERINRELDADFNIAQFDHFPTYDPETGACKSFLVSLASQRVHIKAANRLIDFDKDEYINMEISLKFGVEQTKQIAQNAGFQPMHYFFDSKRWFTDAVWLCA